MASHTSSSSEMMDFSAVLPQFRVFLESLVKFSGANIKQCSKYKPGPKKGIDKNKIKYEASKKKANFAKEQFLSQNENLKKIRRTMIYENKMRAVKERKRLLDKSVADVKTLINKNDMDLSKEIEVIEETSTKDVNDITKIILAMELYENQRKNEIEENIKTMEQNKNKIEIEIEEQINKMEQRAYERKNEIEENIEQMEQIANDRLNEIKENIKTMEQNEIKRKNEIDENIKSMEQREATKRDEMGKNISALEQEKNAKITEIEETFMAMKIEIANTIKSLNNEIVNNIQAMKNTIQENTEAIKKVEKHVESIQLRETKKIKSQTEMNIQPIRTEPSIKPISLKRKNMELQRKLKPHNSPKLQKHNEKLNKEKTNIEAMKQREAEKSSEIEKITSAIQCDTEMEKSTEDSHELEQSQNTSEIEEIIHENEGREAGEDFQLGDDGTSKMDNNIDAVPHRGVEEGTTQMTVNIKRMSLKRKNTTASQHDGEKCSAVEKNIHTTQQREAEGTSAVETNVNTIQQRDAEKGSETESYLINIMRQHSSGQITANESELMARIESVFTLLGMG